MGAHPYSALSPSHVSRPMFLLLLRYHARTVGVTLYHSVVLSALTKLCNHHHYAIPEHFHQPERSGVPVSGHSPSSLPPAPTTTNVPPVSMATPVRVFHVNGSQYVALCVCPFPLSGFPRSVRPSTYHSSTPVTANYYPMVQRGHFWSPIHLLTDPWAVAPFCHPPMMFLDPHALPHGRIEQV